MRVISSITVIFIFVMSLLNCSNEGDRKSSENTSTTPAITVEKLHQDHDNGVPFYLLDVRTQPEYNESHIGFANELIPYDSLEFHQNELPQNKDTLLYVYCRTGRRSGIATDYLRSIGYTNVHNVTGGITAWKEVGYETVADSIQN